MSSLSHSKRSREESREPSPTRAPASRELPKWIYPEEVAMMSPDDIFKSVKGLYERRYQQDMYRMFSHIAVDSTLASMKQRWLDCRGHDIDAVDALIASRRQSGGKFKASTKLDLFTTVHTFDLMREVDVASQSDELAERLAVLLFDHMTMMCLEAERNRYMPDVAGSFPSYLEDFEKLAKLLESRRLQRSVKSQAPASSADELFTKDSADMVDRLRVDAAAVGSKDKIGGYTQAKKDIFGAAYLFTDLPHLTELGMHSQGILLHGVTGTGKTSLALSIAEGGRCSVFHMRSSDVVDKWVGSTERNVRAVFSIAQTSRPSVIFIDEVDALFGARRNDASATEKRLKSELLSAMTKYSKVLVVAATNLPWALDPAFKSRFHQHIHIRLPNEDERAEILRVLLRNVLHVLAGDDFATVAKSCDGFTGGTIRQLIRRQFMAALADIPGATWFCVASLNGQEVYYPCAAEAPGAQAHALEHIKSKVHPAPITREGLLSAVEAEKPSVRSHRDEEDKQARWSVDHFQE